MAAQPDEMTNIQTIIKNQMSQVISSNTPSNIPVCKFCGAELKYFETNLFGSIRRFPVACDCEIEDYENNLKRQENERKINRKNEVFSVTKLGDKFKDRTFQNWKPREGAENASLYTRRFIKSVKNNEKAQSLIVWGISGNGKTELTACAYNELTNEGFNCIFTKVVDLLNLISCARKGELKLTESKIYDIFRDADAVFLDDLGTEVYTDNWAVWLYNIIEIIYNYEIPSIITMNEYAPQKMAVNESMTKVFDRFKEIYLRVQNKATSYREWIEQQRFKQIKENQI